MGIDDVERMRSVRVCCERRELSDERACHRKIGLGAVDRISPMHRYAAGAVSSLAPLPVDLAHMHAKWRGRLLRVGHYVYIVTALGKRMSSPVRAHAHAALDGRELTYNADPQRRSPGGR
jgi:hypothetical protein